MVIILVVVELDSSVMKCLNPQKIYNKSLGRSIWTACGRCSHCNENRREQWLFRLDNELKYCSFGVHCTFQYSNDYLGDNILDRKHIQNLFKLLRKKGLIFKYYGIGEYGTQDHRKHFHVAFFVQSPMNKFDFKSLVDSCWKFGFVYYTRLCHTNLAYVLHYHVRPKIVDDKPTFQFFSKGLGSVFLEDELWKNYFVSSRSIMVRNFQNKPIPFPRYYRKKLGLEGLEMFNNVKTIYDVISEYFHKPIEDIPRTQIQKYLITLFEHDQKKINKYNSQKKGV